MCGDRGWGGSHSSQPMASGMVSLSCQANPRGSELPYMYPCVLPSLLVWLQGWRQWLDGRWWTCVGTGGGGGHTAVSPWPQAWFYCSHPPTLTFRRPPICALACCQVSLLGSEAGGSGLLAPCALHPQACGSAHTAQSGTLLARGHACIPSQNWWKPLACVLLACCARGSCISYSHHAIPHRQYTCVGWDQDEDLYVCASHIGFALGPVT